jgi:Cof subfamily protein (haloacid dehalogenase superfamily)
MNDASSLRYRLLACDLDGTLMGKDTKISPRVRNAVSSAQKRGIFVTLATGRGFLPSLPFARALHITFPLICYQGGIIKHPISEELLYCATMERTLVIDAIELARTRNWHIVVYIGDDILIEKRRRANSFYKRWLGAEIKQVMDLRLVVSESPWEPAKFLIVVKPHEGSGVHHELKVRFDGVVDIVRSHEMFVEGSPAGENKGKALCRLAQHYDVEQESVMAIGDQENDVSMLSWAGLGVAMGGGSQAAEAVADWIAPPLASDGAAIAIERFLLS